MGVSSVSTKNILICRMDFEQLKKVVLDRHTVRVFTNTPIENGVMEEILGYSLVFLLFDTTI